MPSKNKRFYFIAQLNSNLLHKIYEGELERDWQSDRERKMKRDREIRKKEKEHQGRKGIFITLMYTTSHSTYTTHVNIILVVNENVNNRPDNTYITPVNTNITPVSWINGFQDAIKNVLSLLNISLLACRPPITN